MNLSVSDTGGALLVVSQFTLYGDVRRGKRPSFDAAAPPQHARELYDISSRRSGPPVFVVKPGVFRKRCRWSWSTKARLRFFLIPGRHSNIPASENKRVIPG